MKIHEYQAMEIFRKYNIPTSNGKVVENPDSARKIAEEMNAESYVVKAQVHAGGRGQAGGIRIVHSPEEVFNESNDMLGKYLKTAQTDQAGQLVNKILICKAVEINKEYYLGYTVDNSSESIILLASSEGGVDIEKIASENPDRLFHQSIDQYIGVRSYQLRNMAYKLGIKEYDLVKKFIDIAFKLYKIFIEKDCNTIEINPLSLTPESNLVAIDAKMIFDDNALYKHSDIKSLADYEQVNSKEFLAESLGVSYVSLSGNIGCMVNGAGLAMATMDIIQYYGGYPANFLDVGGSATEEKIAGTLEILISDSKVKGVLINIFGGIMRCDIVAKGVIKIAKKSGITIPIVVRLKGTNEKEGKQLFEESGLNIYVVDDLTEAIKEIVKQVAIASNSGSEF